MKALTQQTLVFKSISELMATLGQPKPLHPLIAVVHYERAKPNLEHAGKNFLIDFYKISFKKDFKGQVKYGQGHYDFEEGGLAFLGPNQLVTMSGEERNYEGHTLYFHADLIRNTHLGKNMQQYGFFSYAVNEALFLSEKEKDVILAVFKSIATELDHHIDAFSQDVLVSQLELLLNHSNRFYNRQFVTRKAVYHDLIDNLKNYLDARLEQNRSSSGGLPAVQEVADHLQVSARYLTDLLKSLTGQSTQQHIHSHLIEKAKDKLITSRLSIAEIAYQLGFEHPQSFNKLFKRCTTLSPNAYRQSFN